MKYIVDTSILNKLVEGDIKPGDLPSDGSFVASHVQIDEINKTKDEERRARLFLQFVAVVDDVVPTESAVMGASRIGHCKISNGGLYMKVKGDLDLLNDGKKNNVMDALIAEIAIKNGITLLTADYHLKEVAVENGCKVIYWPSNRSKGQ